MMAKPLGEYHRKRNFHVTSEPSGETGRNKKAAHALQFVIQKHDARRLHYDFRLELDGTLKSWAVPKGPSLDPKDKRLAVHVEDHPISYANFEGNIPHGQYGGGDVIVWDHGVWQPHGDARTAYKSGKLKFTLIGEKLSGDWTLVRTHLRGSNDKEQWLLIKERDEMARTADEYDIVTDKPQSVITGDLLPVDKSENTSKSDPQKKPSAKKTEKKINEKGNSAKKITSTKNTPKKSLKSTVGIRDENIQLPLALSPELATLVTEPPAGEWLYEIKFDGYRILTRIHNKEVRLFTRNGNDWTDRLPLQKAAIEALNLGDSWLDGEVIVPNDQGLPDFQALQNAFEIGRSHQILYYLFDAPFLNGQDLREQPIEYRRAELEKIIPAKRAGKNNPLRFSAAFAVSHHNIIESACAMSLEGVIGKRSGSNYVSRRSNDWIKLKCRLRQEFVIVGYTEPQGSRSGFGALLVAVNETAGKQNLIYAGRVGTGFNQTHLRELHEQLHRLQSSSSPLKKSLTGAQARGVTWVKPALVCEVEFAEWTGEGVLRQAAFIALRSDKSVRQIIREHANSPAELGLPANKSEKQSEKKSEKKSVNAAQNNLNKAKDNAIDGSGRKQKSAQRSGSAKVNVEQVLITHPDRVIDETINATKEDLAIFYGNISEWILPHLHHRAVSLLRAPEGLGKEQFFQKHSEHLAIPNIKQLAPELDPGHARLMEIDTVQALVGAVQMGTIELHTWGSTSDSIEKPDRITLDLDPDPALPWRSVVEATTLTLAVLDELKLDACLKTTGGKGMHIIIPLAPSADWEQIKAFSKAIATFMAREIPERFVATMGPKNRIGKIFIDYLRNQRGASTVSAYSVRARPGLAVSVPIARRELNELTGSAQWNINNLHERLGKLKSDPWSDSQHRQKITQAMRRKLGMV